MSKLKQRVDFSRIRYANCWEDARLLLDSVRIGAHEQVLIIASAGDNALACLSREPGSVTAVDLSLPQLYLCELKQSAFAMLEYDELLIILGVRGTSSAARWMLYEKLRPGLGEGARSYWNVRRTAIERGLIHEGKFEQYFAMFRRWLLPLGHSKVQVRRLLEPKSDEQQASFFEKAWNSWRWKALMGLFFSRPVMGRYGRDPQFLKHVSLNVPDYIRSKAEAHLRLGAATRNPFLHYIMQGIFGDQLPEYLRPELFQDIKRNIGRLHLAEMDMDEAVMQRPYDVYCASNIFEYMSAEAFGALVTSWSSAIPKGARVAYWNLMAPRSFSEVSPGNWLAMEPAPGVDNGFFYSRFMVEKKR